MVVLIVYVNLPGANRTGVRTDSSENRSLQYYMDRSNSRTAQCTRQVNKLNSAYNKEFLPSSTKALSHTV